MRLKYFMLAGIMLFMAGCSERSVVGAYDDNSSNIIEIRPQVPVKITTQRDLDTIVQDGVVLSISELSYEMWDKADIVEEDGKLSSTADTLYGIMLVFNTDWSDLGLLKPESVILDKENVQFIMKSGDVLQEDEEYSNVSVSADIYSGNAKITYEWFSKSAEADEKPALVRLPFRFESEGETVDLHVEILLNRYPW